MNLNLCTICKQVVSDPVCAKCYFREFVLWLNDQNLSLDQRTKMIKKIRGNLMRENVYGEICILCQNNNVSLCLYCFFTRTRGFLESVGAPKDTIEKFLMSFNYDIYNTPSAHKKEEKNVSRSAAVLEVSAITTSAIRAIYNISDRKSRKRKRGNFDAEGVVSYDFEEE